MARVVTACSLLTWLMTTVVAHGGLSNYTVGEKWYRG